MNNQATIGKAETTSRSHHELQEEIAQLKEREQVLVSENDQLRTQLVEMKQQANKKYDDLLMEYNMKREYEDDGTSNNQVTVKTEWDDEDVKPEIKVEIKEEYGEEDHDIFIKQEDMSAYIKTESSDVKVEIKEEIKEEDDEDDRGCDLRLVKKELVSDDDDNSQQLDDPVNEVVQPNLNLSRDQLNTPTNSVNVELSPSANCQMKLTNSSQIEQSVDQQVDKADHEPNEPANHGHNQWPTTQQSQSRTRKRTAMTRGQVSMNGPMTNSKRTRVETDLHRTETVQEVSAVALDKRQVDEQIGGGGGFAQIEDDDDETELGEEDQGGRYKIEIIKLKCTEDGCEDEVADREELHDHLRVIHHIFPYRCFAEGCKERFEQWDGNGLSNHVQHNHSNISTWPCAHCTSTFKSQRLLCQHLHLYHLQGQFNCGYVGCHYDRVATIRSEIRNHQLSAHSPTKIYTCQFKNCGKSFNRKGTFNIHQRIHSGVKPFRCDWIGCDKSFTQKASLNDHQQTHQGIKAFCCESIGCGKSFTRMRQLNDHQRIHQNVKPFKCTWNMCDYSSAQQSNVITHIRTQHFNLPRSQKKQRELGIEDNRNPHDYLQQEQN